MFFIKTGGVRAG